MASLSSRSQRSWIRKPIARDATVSCSTWCDGPGMKGWMRRLRGFRLTSLDTPWTLSPPSTHAIWVSQDQNLLRWLDHHPLSSSAIASLGLVVFLTILILGLQGFRPKKGILSYPCTSTPTSLTPPHLRTLQEHSGAIPVITPSSLPYAIFLIFW